jgi:hypothetical protein
MAGDRAGDDDPGGQFHTLGGSLGVRAHHPEHPLITSDLMLCRTYFLAMSKETLFALSLFPYLGFLWSLNRSQQAPRLALIGFYLTLLFVAVTIPAGLYALNTYGQTLANVDWLHGSAEAFLTLANVFVVLGFHRALRQYRHQPKA